MMKSTLFYLRHSLTFLWLWSGLQPVLYARETSLRLLAQVVFSAQEQLPILYAASLLDVLFALGCALNIRKSWFWLAQMVTVLAYSLVIAFRLPEMWAHPFAPLVKNIPILAILFFLYQQNRSEENV